LTVTDTTIEKAPGACDPEGLATRTSSNSSVAKFSEIRVVEQLALNIAGTEPRVDSRLLAKQLGNQHKAVMTLVERYADRMMAFGQLPFQMEVGKRRQGGGNAERLAMLNDDQAFFLLSLARNTDHFVDLKAKLIVAFRDARRAAEQRGAEYLPPLATSNSPTFGQSNSSRQDGRIISRLMCRVPCARRPP